MATSFKAVDVSYRIGCGRYIQESGALNLLPAEVRRLGKKHAFVLADSVTLPLAGERAAELLRADGLQAEVCVYDLFCCQEEAKRLIASDAFRACDIVVGVGGGNILDYAKLCAVWAGMPVICAPTSSATCAAFTPLSVTYNERFQTVGTVHHLIEVNAVVADMDILCRQPARLLTAGAYDAAAKLIETAQRLKDRPEEEINIGVRAAYELSKFTYRRLLEDLPQARLDVQAGKNTKAVYDVVYNAIAATGAVSGMARGSNQTAIAHKVYEISRVLFPDTVRYRLHGELVATGLVAQLHYNGEPERAEEFRARLAGDGMPGRLSDIGLPATEETLDAYYQKLLVSSAMAGTDAEEHARLRRALAAIL